MKSIFRSHCIVIDRDRMGKDRFFDLEYAIKKRRKLHNSAKWSYLKCEMYGEYGKRGSNGGDGCVPGLGGHPGMITIIGLLEKPNFITYSVKGMFTSIHNVQLVQECKEISHDDQLR